MGIADHDRGIGQRVIVQSLNGKGWSSEAHISSSASSWKSVFVETKITSAFRGTESGRVPFVNDPSGFFPLSGTRLTVRTLGTQARNLRRDRSLPPLRLLAGIGFCVLAALVGIGLDGWPCDATGRRPNVDNRCRGSKSRPHRPLDSSASDSVLSRNLSLSKHVESRSQ